MPPSERQPHPHRGGGRADRRDSGQSAGRDRARPDRQDPRPDRQGARPDRQGARPGRREDDRRRTAPSARPAGANDQEHRRPRLREPELPGDVSPRDLDRAARADLRTVPASLADRIAAHLVAAGRLLDDDPQRARDHAWYARSLAPRLATVREAAGVTAYRAGDYSAALAELRAVRRMTGDPGHLPVMADAERGLGRPDRALALARDPDVKRLDQAARVELAIVASGARRDRGEYDAAVVGLQGAALDSDRLQPWTARLWYAYAEALLDAGRPTEARRWFESVAAIDEAGETDAEERVAALPEP